MMKYIVMLTDDGQNNSVAFNMWSTSNEAVKGFLELAEVHESATWMVFKHGHQIAQYKQMNDGLVEMDFQPQLPFDDSDMYSDC